MPEWAWILVTIAGCVLVAAVIVFRSYATADGQFRKQRKRR